MGSAILRDTGKSAFYRPSGTGDSSSAGFRGPGSPRLHSVAPPGLFGAGGRPWKHGRGTATVGLNQRRGACGPPRRASISLNLTTPGKRGWGRSAARPRSTPVRSFGRSPPAERRTPSHRARHSHPLAASWSTTLNSTTPGTPSTPAARPNDPARRQLNPHDAVG